MWKKFHILLAILPVICWVVFGTIGYQLDKKSHELEAKKVREGQIPKKNLQIETYGGSNVTQTFRVFVDEPFSIYMGGKELKNLYSISYRIENTGKAPILQSDFSENLKLMFPERWKILVLKNLTTTPPEMNPVWEKRVIVKSCVWNN